MEDVMRSIGLDTEVAEGLFRYEVVWLIVEALTELAGHAAFFPRNLLGASK